MQMVVLKHNGIWEGIKHNDRQKLSSISINIQDKSIYFGKIPQSLHSKNISDNQNDSYLQACNPYLQYFKY